ncbi:phosphatidylinositol synthase [Klebsormidium nitens]|uniref:CDP-diacylglycerol--inositol 3-phosphatidyltransferase n=1 Tax=Klebsormidium nitens TaxID=105231 RepID=A0A1Y1I3T9_KLENI|nr:phosphatidylinositol synthase [Klebsormidium nitens]|eukprot:GAQ84622.1 phosphatidylinositol synthase [Klebsormidium nitens]
MALSIYLYVPNLIGYLRVVLNMVAFAHAFKDSRLFLVLYLLSFVCDELDGRFARLLNQTSTFGAVLDMVTDRVSTAGLLLVLSHLYKDYWLACLGLLVLDVASHWLQMYSTFLVSKTSHKDVDARAFFLLRLYYRYRAVMGYCCIGAEVLYLCLYLLHDPLYWGWPALPAWAHTERGAVYWLAGLAAPGWAVKQVVNLVQLKTAADVCVSYDVERLQKVEKKTP